jgi:hypothetical protein
MAGVNMAPPPDRPIGSHAICLGGVSKWADVCPAPTETNNDMTSPSHLADSDTVRLKGIRVSIAAPWWKKDSKAALAMSSLVRILFLAPRLLD